MIEIAGKYGIAKVYTDKVEQTAVSQIINMMNQDWIKDQPVAIMPDVHAGAGGVIGLTIRLDKNVIPPDLVGSDIGCGVTLFLTNYKIQDKLELAKWLDDEVRSKVPSGAANHKHINLTDDLDFYLDNNLFMPYDETAAGQGFGTLGGGNHFIEAYDYNGYLAIAIHTGSRKLGSLGYKFYKGKAKKRLQNEFNIFLKNKIDELKKSSKHKEIQSYIETANRDYDAARPSQEIPVLTGDDALDYINDVEVLTEYARLNRLEIFKQITKDLGLEKSSVLSIDKPHNYIEQIDVTRDNGEIETVTILRKGAQSGYGGEKVVIPINMRDGSILGTVRSDDPELVERNYSFPHGAGRVKSRSQARAELDLEVFKDQMKGVYSTSVGLETLDEAPDAYKSISDIGEETVHLFAQGSMELLRPFYNHKGVGENYV